MRILIIGRGGREHALAKCCLDSNLVSKVYVAPGNGGMCNDFEVVNINEDEITNLVDFAKQEKIDLTIVGPEVCLSLGVVDEFTKHNLMIFGPTSSATMIESSKEFSKDLMKKYSIPTAKYEVFDCYESALNYIEENGYPIVVKYDGLAAGKGVVIVENKNQAIKTLKDMLVDCVYGSSKVVIEEFLEGIEFSLMTMVNGENVFALEVSQDHKQLNDNDMGPNTGGMGAFSPVDCISQDIISQAVEEVMKPVATALVKEGKSFTGFLYGGLMYTKSGVKVIEFNARFGDPEAEVVLPRLESDFVESVLDVMSNKKPNLVWSSDYVVGVVLASKGYPESYEKGFEIKGDLSSVFHMGTKMEETLVTSGGRVLLVTGRSNTLESAIENAYLNVSKVDCPSLIYRNDIGRRTNKL